MKNNHICIISPSLKIGGIERALTVLANYFAQKGMKVTFISCLKGEYFYKLDYRIELIEPHFRRKKSIADKLLFYPRLIFYIRKKVKRVKPDKVLAFGDWFSPLVLLALYKMPYPVYISDRTSPDYNFKFPIPQLKKWLYPRSAGFIAQTRRAAEYKQEQFGNKLRIKIIPNAIREVTTYPEMKRENIILYVGRFAWEKGPERLIKAFANIQNRNGWELIMAGSGPLLNPMKALAQKLGVSEEIQFLGNVKDVDRLYARAGIYVLPSVLEGFPNSLAEAMAAGVPSVCFDSIPHEEIIEYNKTGIVIEDGNINKMTEHIEYLINHPDKRKELGENAQHIRQTLSVENVGDKVLEFMDIR
jgi:glycosyltransferase involved in cell wall biosynthesis